jgi:hypothetical protein
VTLTLLHHPLLGRRWGREEQDHGSDREGRLELVEHLFSP